MGLSVVFRIIHKDFSRLIEKEALKGVEI